MKSSTAISQQQENLIEQLKLIYDHRGYAEKPAALPYDVVINECAQAWGINPEDLIGKINPSKDLDMARKTSLLYGMYLFTEFTEYDFKILKYGQIAVWRADEKIVNRFLGNEYYRHFAGPILNFIQRLISIAPKRFKVYLDYATEAKRKKEEKHTSAGITVKSYVEELEKDIKFYRELIESKLLNTDKLFKVAEKQLKPKNTFNPFWQDDWAPIPHLDDLTGGNRYLLWQGEPRKCSLVVKGFSDDIDSFFDIHIN